MRHRPPERHGRTNQGREDSQPTRLSRRFMVLRAGIILTFVILSLQLFRLQILETGRYRLLAQSNRIKVIPTLPSRGLIFDRFGRPLVQNQPTFSVYLTPATVPKGHEQDVYYALQQAMGLSASDIKTMVDSAIRNGASGQPVMLKSDIDETTALKLAELRSTVPALDVEASPIRNYLDGSLISHILGYVGKLDASEYRALKNKGYQLNDQVGKSGLELMYEDQLRGTPGLRSVEIDAAGHELRTLNEQPAEAGDNLTLTVDSTLQTAITNILKNSLQHYKSPSGVAIMMDVHTGDILADVSLPSYDDNLFSSPIPDATWQALLNDPGKPLVDHAISDIYPPGSTFKQITGLAALQTGVATPATTIATTGKLVVANKIDPSGGDIFPDWTNLGTVDFYHAVAMSSDEYFYCLSGGCPQVSGGPATGVGPDALARYARMFGLGERTGIDLPNEATGIVPDPQWKERTQHQQWLLGDTYFFGIGQGYVETTPLQMLRVTAAIANGGAVLRPHLVKEIRDARGNLVRPDQTEPEQHLQISSQNLSVMRQAMLDMVEDGSAPAAKVPGLRIAGKSGTAEFGARVYAPSGEDANGTYNEHGWFVSFAPYDDPQVALVVFDELGGGALTAAPTSATIWDYYFHEYLPSHSKG